MTTKLSLQTSQVQESTESRLFKDNSETVGLQEAVTWVGKQTEVLEQLFEIFTKDTRA